MKNITLKNSLEIFHISEEDTNFIYSELFDNHCYLRNGISLKKGDYIFDVGANIGLSALYFYLNCPDIKLFCFEPVPEIFSVLTANVKRHEIPAKLFNIGLFDVPCAKKFTYYPNHPALSNARANPAKDIGDLIQIAESKGRMNAILAQISTFNHEFFECELSTLSNVIESENVDTIDLLKIDVEGSELKILEGIGKNDWVKIKQIVMEVHPAEGVFLKIYNILEGQGFNVTAEQEPIFDGTLMYNLYARR